MKVETDIIGGIVDHHCLKLSYHNYFWCSSVSDKTEL